VVTVLAAVVDLIRDQGGAESETEYFATLLSCLETSTAPPTVGGEEAKMEGFGRLAALGYLLQLNVNKVPRGVLANTFGQSSKVFFDFCSIFLFYDLIL
jgi:hypothetical protein